ncbi:MAG: molecular chaperone [Gemmatimonadales bacterium]|nr:molecular chaperone [Gemmatimonadales bacterium]
MTLRTALVLAVLAVRPAAAEAQGVLIAPTALFIDARVRAASLLLVNPSTDPAEVEIGAIFGYPVTDSSGQVVLHTTEHPDSTEPSATAWVKVFPRRMSIPGNGQQTVRLLVSPPPGVADGEYWSRLVITARGGRLPITSTTDTSGVKVGLSVEVRTIIPLLYRKGKVATGPELSDVRAAREGDSLVVRGTLSRSGNAALLATVRGELADSAGRVRAGFATPISAYHTMHPRFALPLDSVPPGRYRLRLEVSSVRQDLGPESVLPFRTLRDSLAVQLP